jgi:hypothetical protein
MQDFITHNEYLTGNRANSLINRKMIFRILGILLFAEFKLQMQRNSY